MPPTATWTSDDLRISPEAIASLADAVIAGHEVTAGEGRALLDIEADSATGEALFAAARHLRATFLGDVVKCCSILNVKAGNCSENCSYCAQASGVPAEGYDRHKWLPDEDIVAAAESAAANGAQALGLVAAWWGVKEGAQLDMVCEAVGKLSRNGSVRADVNLGILESQTCADRLAAAGAKVYGHNLETARSFFDDICTTHSFADRMRTIGYIKKAGMGLCSGGIIGMGETRDQRIEFAEQIRFIEPDMVPINFLNPIPGTKLGHLPPMDADEALVSLATMRVMLPGLNLMVAGGKEVVFGDRLAEIFKTGVNAVMVGNYLTTLGTDPTFWREATARYGLRLALESADGGCGDSCGHH